MAAESEVCNELSPFLLEVAGLEEAARKEEDRAVRGAYGYVFKVTVGNMECIAKKLHTAFVEVSEVSVSERGSISNKFRNECLILSKLRHPNIVQFVGVHLGLRNDLTLIMECLKCDLDDFLSKHLNLPLSVKLSMLLDVSYGLVYLHECNPPIIHRDLTARNILVTDKGLAKIADLGMAKIVPLQEQLAPVHTQNPGQMFYMPPEAMKVDAECTSKLDIFSFGHLALFTVNQVFPKVEYHMAQTHAMQEEGTVERARRAAALKDVGKDHCLYLIITECLYDRPDQRPITRDLNKRLSHLSAQNVDICGNLQCMNTNQSYEQSKERIDQMENGFNLMMQQVEKLETAKREAQEEAATLKAEAEDYKKSLQEERKECEKAQKALADLKKIRIQEISAMQQQNMQQAQREAELREELQTTRDLADKLKTKIKPLAVDIDDLKFEIKQRKKAKSHMKQLHVKLKGQLSHATQCTVELTEKLEALMKEKKSVEKALAKSEERVKKLEKAQNQAHGQSLYQPELASQDSNELLHQEIDSLNSDIVHLREIITLLKTMLTTNEKALEVATSENELPAVPDQQMSTPEQATTQSQPPQSSVSSDRNMPQETLPLPASPSQHQSFQHERTNEETQFSNTYQPNQHKPSELSQATAKTPYSECGVEIAKSQDHKAPLEHVPFDPSLECLLCGKCHRIGELQEFRLHLDQCDGDCKAN